MKKSILNILFFVVIGNAMSAQIVPSASVYLEIAEVQKHDSVYLYADITESDSALAMNKAKELFLFSVSKSFPEASPNAIAQAATFIVLPRGDKYRAFIYLRREVLLPSTSRTIVPSRQTALINQQSDSRL